jgi:poly(3-hydroxybutyrate) depolymerase
MRAQVAFLHSLLLCFSEAFKARAVTNGTDLLPCGESKHEGTFAGMTRSYILYIPQTLCNAGPTRAVPLVLLYHGFTASIRQTLDPSIPGADEHGFVLLSTQGLQDSFNGGACCGHAADAKIDDVGVARAIVADLLQRSQLTAFARISADAVYALGFSNGGFMASTLGSKMPELAGFVAMGGHTYELHDIVNPIMVTYIVSDKDELVNSEGCCSKLQCCCQIDQRSGDTCTSSTAIFQRWVSVNKCQSVNIVDGAESSCSEGVGCARPTKFCHYKSVSHDGVLHRFDSKQLFATISNDISSRLLVK